MDQATAIKKLGKLLGKQFGYRIDKQAPTRAERDAAREALSAANVERKSLGEKREARVKALLEADDEYKALNAAYRNAQTRAELLLSTSHRYRLTVGKTVAGMFFSVHAEGDNWQEVVDKVAAKHKAAA